MIRRWRDRRHHDHHAAESARPAEHRRSYRMSLASTWPAARTSRRITVTVLTGWGVPPRTLVHDAAVLAVTELVTNAVRHTGSRSPFFDLLLAVSGTHLEAGVRDGHPDLPDVPRAGDEGGLADVAGLVRHLGGELKIQPVPDGGKTVYVRLPLSPPSPSTAIPQ
ncbi:ATP-binding protein [Streptomyces sp. SP17BM10]|uniref:ATP-binding protein n=1 Tax=Streptomyces sp. SP17BM10 TaxID=3002530 RepID=UPI002E790B65|nr:ATP-binding protein [Streptomyces sp. SP17BM10]MEE1783272.1 ATP-binding protein [Streptomyces sp. SP17BM10]